MTKKYIKYVILMKTNIFMYISINPNHLDTKHAKFALVYNK